MVDLLYLGCVMYNRHGVAGAVLQIDLSLINSFGRSLIHPFPPNLQDIINPKQLELEN